MVETGYNYHPHPEDEMWNIDTKIKKFEDLFLRLQESSNLKEIKAILKSLEDKISTGMIRKDQLIAMLELANCSKEEIENWEINDRSIKSFLELVTPDISKIKIDSEILPKGKGVKRPHLPPEVEGKENKTFPKTEYLKEILEEIDSGILEIESSWSLYKGFLLSDIRKIVLVSNEERNSTYIIHDIIPDDLEKIQKIMSLSKESLRQSGLDVVRIDFEEGREENWRNKIKEELMKSPNLEENEVFEEDFDVEVEPVSFLATIFLKTIEDEALKIKGAKELYEEFMSKHNLAPAAYTRRAFAKHLVKIRKERGIGNKEERSDSEILVKVNYFLNNLSDTEIVEKTSKEFYKMFLVEAKLNEDGYGYEKFRSKFANELRKRKLRSDYSGFGKDVRKLFEDFLGRLLNAEIDNLTKKKGKLLYDRFLLENSLEEDDCVFSTFYRDLRKEVKGRGLRCSVVRNDGAAKLAKDFFADLSDERLAETDLSVKFDEFIELHKNSVATTYSRRAFGQLQSEERKKRKVRSEKTTDPEVAKDVFSYISSLSDEKILGLPAVLHRDFLKEFGHDEVKYSKVAFTGMLYSERKRRKLSKNEVLDQDKLNNLNSFLSSLSEGQLRGGARDLYNSFLKEFKYIEISIPFKKFKNRLHTIRKNRGIKILKRKK